MRRLRSSKRIRVEETASKKVPPLSFPAEGLIEGEWVRGVASCLGDDMEMYAFLVEDRAVRGSVPRYELERSEIRTLTGATPVEEELSAELEEMQAELVAAQCARAQLEAQHKALLEAAGVEETKECDDDRASDDDEDVEDENFDSWGNSGMEVATSLTDEEICRARRTQLINTCVNCYGIASDVIESATIEIYISRRAVGTHIDFYYRIDNEDVDFKILRSFKGVGRYFNGDVSNSGGRLGVLLSSYEDSHPAFVVGCFPGDVGTWSPPLTATCEAMDPTLPPISYLGVCAGCGAGNQAVVRALGVEGCFVVLLDMDRKKTRVATENFPLSDVVTEEVTADGLSVRFVASRPDIVDFTTPCQAFTTPGLGNRAELRGDEAATAKVSAALLPVAFKKAIAVILCENIMSAFTFETMHQGLFRMAVEHGYALVFVLIKASDATSQPCVYSKTNGHVLAVKIGQRNRDMVVAQLKDLAKIYHKQCSKEAPPVSDFVNDEMIWIKCSTSA